VFTVSDSQASYVSTEKAAGKVDNMNNTAASRVSWQADLPESVKEKQEQVFNKKLTKYSVKISNFDMSF
jgi:hypothetical protein